MELGKMAEKALSTEQLPNFAQTPGTRSPTQLGFGSVAFATRSKGVAALQETYLLCMCRTNWASLGNEPQKAQSTGEVKALPVFLARTSRGISLDSMCHPLARQVKRELGQRELRSLKVIHQDQESWGAQRRERARGMKNMGATAGNCWLRPCIWITAARNVAKC